MKRSLNKAFLALGLCVTMTAALALSTDRDEPINIEADQAEADDALGVTIYKGDVVITQGTLNIRGDVVTIHFDADQDITKVVAEGRPAKFKQKPDGSETFQNAEARTMEFYANDDTIVLLGDAVSWQGDNRISAQRIVYDTRKGKVKAESLAGSGDGDSTGRVSITITPKKKKTESE